MLWCGKILYPMQQIEIFSLKKDHHDDQLYLVQFAVQLYSDMLSRLETSYFQGFRFILKNQEPGLQKELEEIENEIDESLKKAMNIEFSSKKDLDNLIVILKKSEIFFLNLFAKLREQNEKIKGKR
jgi:hypothetical protein